MAKPLEIVEHCHFEVGARQRRRKLLADGVEGEQALQEKVLPWIRSAPFNWYMRESASLCQILSSIEHSLLRTRRAARKTPPHRLHSAVCVARARFVERCAARAPDRSSRVRHDRSLPRERTAPAAAARASSSSTTRPCPIRRPQSVCLLR